MAKTVICGKITDPNFAQFPLAKVDNMCEHLEISIPIFTIQIKFETALLCIYTGPRWACARQIYMTISKFSALLATAKLETDAKF